MNGSMFRHFFEFIHTIRLRNICENTIDYGKIR